MTKKSAPILIMARPSLLRDGLRAVLSAIPHAEIVGQVADGPAALGMVLERHPALVVLEGDRPGKEVWNVLRQIKAEWPQTRCVVLADDALQQGAANAAGADIALLKGFPAEELFTMIERLLPEDKA